MSKKMDLCLLENPLNETLKTANINVAHFLKKQQISCGNKQ
jgi:hypothetical protein